MSIKRLTIEVNPFRRPFKEGETLVTYAMRILEEECLDGDVSNISASVAVIDASPHSHQPTYVLYEEKVEIEVRTAGMVR